MVDLDGGSVSQNQTGQYALGSSLNLRTPSKEGAIFSHWSIVSGNGTMSGNILTFGITDIEIRANWIETFTLTFNANGGSVSPSTKETANTTQYGELPIPIRADYTFAGWYTEATGGTKVISTTIINTLENHTLYAHWVKTETEFAYTGDIKTFTAPIDGNYKLEVWGAQGGGTNGGYGGYSVGTIYLAKNTEIYIVVGKQPLDGVGGYNGGGSVTGNSYGGGGATHIASSVGILKDVVSSNLYIVSSGGGGTGNGYAGGAGGGFTGCNGKGEDYGRGATQSAGGGITNSTCGAKSGTYGQGASVSWSNEAIGAGGGGYYGGGSGGGANSNGGGGGGSSYIGNSLLTSKYMYCYGCTESTVDSTYTINTIGSSTLRDAVNCPDGYSIDTISKCAKSGDGYAKITYLGGYYE